MEEVVGPRVCIATYDLVAAPRLDETHTCDLEAGHERAHHCPTCGNYWAARRSHHANHPFR